MTGDSKLRTGDGIVPAWNYQGNVLEGLGNPSALAALGQAPSCQHWWGTMGINKV